MYKLLMRAFPGWYRPNSVYALYPFTAPQATLEIFQKRGAPKDLDFGSPSALGSPKQVVTWQGVVDVLKDQQRFKVPCKTFLYFLPPPFLKL